MNQTEAKKLIATGECGTIEFKLKANHPEKIIREVVAFANSRGGHLFVGVSDDGQINGLKYPDEEEFVVTKAIQELCRPPVPFTIDKIKIEQGVEILHYEIRESEEKPHYAFLEKKHRYGKAFVRVEDRSIQASYEVRKYLGERTNFDQPISLEENTQELFKYFENHPTITLSQYRHLTGLNKRLASKKLVSLALSGALKIEPREGEDLYLPLF